MQSPEYTGTWIPKHIMQDANLSAANKMLYAQIASFETCYASNNYFAKQSGVTERSIQRGLAELEKKGYIIRSGDDESVRVIIALRDKPAIMAFRGDGNVVPPTTETSSPPTTETSSNNKVNNKEKEKTSAKANESLFFELVEILGYQTTKVKFTVGRQSKLAARIRGAGAADVVAAARGLTTSLFHMGSNPNGVKYATIDFLLRNDEIIEKWRDISDIGKKSNTNQFTIGAKN